MIDFNDAGPIVPKVAVSGDGSTGVIPLKGNAPVAGPGAEIIPFGKYRGQPAEVLASDRGYTDWLVAQPWFRERYANIYTLVINNFQESADTPEHNAIQGIFLDRIMCARLADIAIGHKLDKARKYEIGKAGFEGSNGADVYFSVYYKYCDGDEPNNSDGSRYKFDEIIVIEIKPSIGDDYPTVLRQMKRRMTGHRDWDGNYVNDFIHVLFIERYIGYGLTQDQFIQMFEDSNIKVVFRDQLDAGG